MGKLIRASALVLLLAFNASAGVMINGVYEPPPPPPQQSSQVGQEPVAVDQEAVAESEETVIPLVIQVALDLFALL